MLCVRTIYAQFPNNVRTIFFQCTVYVCLKQVLYVCLDYRLCMYSVLTQIRDHVCLECRLFTIRERTMLWLVYELCIFSVRNIYVYCLVSGLCYAYFMDYVYLVYGICIFTVWTIYVWCKDYVCLVNGLCMFGLRTIYVQCTDYVCLLYGLCIFSVRTTRAGELSKLVAVHGDITQPRLGLSTEDEKQALFN